MYRCRKLLTASRKHFTSYYQTRCNIASYDYIVVGCGSAGCVLANRLSESGQDSVLAIEDGPEDPWWDISIHMPSALITNIHSDRYNWLYSTTPQKHLNDRTIKWPRGRVWGGSSSINAMVYIRGHQKDYDRWQSEGAEGWSFDDCLPYFNKAQNHPLGANKYRGDKGPLHVTQAPVSDEITQVFLDAGKEYGLAHNEGFNQETQDGIGRYESTIYKGKRWSTSDAYLKPSLKRENLSTKTRTMCNRIIFEGTKAVGVEIQQGKDIEQIKATKEVILSGGAINSPQLLMLSGVGDENELRKHDIAVQAHLPGVGKDLQDHLGLNLLYYCTQSVTKYKYTKLSKQLSIAARWLFKKDGIGASNSVEAGAFVSTNSNSTHPDAQILFFSVASPDVYQTLPYGESFNVILTTLRPTSRGTITLQSNNPRDYPIIDPNYLSTEEDIVDLRKTLKIGREIVQQSAFDQYRGDEILPGHSVQCDADIDSHIRHNANTLFHPTSTCKMGDVNDPTTVVDSKTRVKGFENLRVIDASIMPSLISGNTNAAVIMMAEKAADIIKDDNKIR